MDKAVFITLIVCITLAVISLMSFIRDIIKEKKEREEK